MSQSDMLERLILAKPVTEWEMMMQPSSSLTIPDTRHLDVVAEAVEALPLRLQLIIEGIHFERATYREMGRRLGISHVHVWRLARQAEALLADSLTVSLSDRYDLSVDNVNIKKSA